jgi:hypothetical protein
MQPLEHLAGKGTGHMMAEEQHLPFKNFLLAYFLKKASWMMGRAR